VLALVGHGGHRRKHQQGKNHRYPADHVLSPIDQSHCVIVVVTGGFFEPSMNGTSRQFFPVGTTVPSRTCVRGTPKIHTAIDTSTRAATRMPPRAARRCRPLDSIRLISRFNLKMSATKSGSRRIGSACR